MHGIVRRKILGIKHFVNFNKKGEPYGEVATEMQSYIGVLARTKAPIWYSSWKKVPRERKDKIWDCVQMAYDVPPTAKKMVLKSACQKWREFKSRLTTGYVLPYRDQPELLESPPADYSFIEKGHWDLFVADRLSDEFLAIHIEQQQRRELNKYPHRISRTGYANLELQMSKGDTEIEIDRSSTWKQARKDKDGKFTEDVEKIAKKIDEMTQKVQDGEVVVEGVDDILTKVLGNPEHRGRVRGQGGHVKQSVYFHLPRQKKGKSNIEQKIQEGIQKFMTEQTSKIVAERDAFWAAEMEKLKAALCGKKIRLEDSPIFDSQQGSCSKGVPEFLDSGLNVGAKKKLKLNEDKVDEENQDVEKNKVVEENQDVEKNQVVEENEDVEKNQVFEKNEEIEKNDQESQKKDLLGEGSSEWLLAVGYPTNFVAYATVDLVSDVLHGKVLDKELARVSITRVIQGDATIPFPIGDEIMTVKQACGTYIAWPRYLISENQNSATLLTSAKVNTTKNASRKVKRGDDLYSEPDFVVEMGAGYPPSLKRLWIWANDALKDNRTFSFPLRQEPFGSTKKQVLFLSDVHALCHGGEISASVICIYIHILEEYLKKHKMIDMVSFVDPGVIGAIGCGSAAERSRALAMRFKNAKKGQIFLLPYNHVNHWALTVVNPDSQTAYHMDPLKRRIASDEWTEVVDNGIKLYKDIAKKVLKKKITWENMAGVPLQTGPKDCGLFVMRFMKEICEDKELNFASKWMRRNNLAYSVADINEIKTEWAKFFMKHHAY